MIYISMIYFVGTIHIGDEIIEINGIVVSHLTPSKLRQIMVMANNLLSRVEDRKCIELTK